MTALLRRHLGLAAAVAVCLALGIVLTVAWWLLGGRSSEYTGLVRHLYLGTGFSGAPRLTAVTGDLSLDFIDEDPELPRRFFSVRWQGYWYVPETRTFTLYGSGDDRLDVWIDGRHVISRAPPADMHTVGREITLTAGAHRLRVDYAQQGGAYAMGLSWQPPGARRRVLAPHRLFRDPPGPDEVRLARNVRLLGWGVLLFWVLPLLAVTLLPAMKHADRCRRAVHALSWGRHGPLVLRAALSLALGAVVVRAVFARLPGLNPGSLWYDDLVYAAIMRTEDFWSMITAPLHVGPGLLVIWRGLYTVFPDPEWSLQLLPFASGIAAIPAMALAVRAVTGEDGLAVLAAAVTALNQMLAHYTVFVHQYATEFLVTALFLLAAARLSPSVTAADPRRFARVAVCGGLATFFSVTSVFISFPVVNLGAACAVRDWRRDRGRAVRMLRIAALYNVAVLVAFLLLRNRSNPNARDLFSDGFMPLDSVASALGFLAEKGRYLLETSLPGWGTGWHLNPGTVSWPLPFLFLGLAWLLAQRSTRFLGLVILCFYAERIVASVLWIYPLGMGRTDVFAFPVGICLFAAGIQAATAALPRPAHFRLAAAAAVVAFALARPVDAWYFDTDDVPLVDHMAVRIDDHDALVLSESAIFLTAFYGPWAVASAPADDASYGTAVTLVRDRTLYLPRSGSQGRMVERFVHQLGPERVWYLAHNTQGWEDDIVDAIRAQGYVVDELHSTSSGRLYRGVHEIRVGVSDSRFVPVRRDTACRDGFPVPRARCSPGLPPHR